MTTDTITPDELSEPRKGFLLTFGLNTGQTLMALTEEEPVLDCESLVVNSVGGETLVINANAIIYTRTELVDIPTEDEVESYRQKLQGRASAEIAAHGNYL